ncbi:hypothetical protein E0H75_26575 [Kribbella capetownensis]|uniref:Uncharacterized protein n=1 Tax=Kribbella capetownensis TaxID=1572659 RepID=A0A4R0JI32_9ACTN|nr:hypothetical protein E0H75_26575 [Kribbella capetownensis]
MAATARGRGHRRADPRPATDRVARPAVRRRLVQGADPATVAGSTLADRPPRRLRHPYRTDRVRRAAAGGPALLRTRGGVEPLHRGGAARPDHPGPQPLGLRDDPGTPPGPAPAESRRTSRPALGGSRRRRRTASTDSGTCRPRHRGHHTIP